MDSKDKKGDRTSDQLKAIRRIMFVQLYLLLFCTVVLLEGTDIILAADSKLNIPYINQTVTVKGFLIFMPTVLLSVNMYGLFLLAAVKGANDALDTNYLFTSTYAVARMTTFLIFYVLTPSVLAYFAWSGLRRPEAIFLIGMLTLSIVASVMAFLSERFGGLRAAAVTSVIFLSVCAVGYTVAYLNNIEDFSKLRLKRTVDLVGQELVHKNMSKLDLRNADMERGIFERSNFRATDLRDALLNGSNLDLTVLKGVNLFEAKLERSSIKEADIRWALLNHATIVSAQLNKSILTCARGEDLRAREAVLTNANLEYAMINESDFDRSNLEKVNLNYADAIGVILTESKMKEASMINADLSNAKLINADLTKVSASLANLGMAELINTKLNGADLSYAILTCAKLQGSEMRGAILKSADLKWADLTNVTLTEGAECEQLKQAMNWEFALRKKACGEKIPKESDISKACNNYSPPVYSNYQKKCENGIYNLSSEYVQELEDARKYRLENASRIAAGKGN